MIKRKALTSYGPGNQVPSRPTKVQFLQEQMGCDWGLLKAEGQHPPQSSQTGTRPRRGGSWGQVWGRLWLWSEERAWAVLVAPIVGFLSSPTCPAPRRAAPAEGAVVWCSVVDFSPPGTVCTVHCPVSDGHWIGKIQLGVGCLVRPKAYRHFQHKASSLRNPGDQVTPERSRSKIQLLLHIGRTKWLRSTFPLTTTRNGMKYKNDINFRDLARVKI